MAREEGDETLTAERVAEPAVAMDQGTPATPAPVRAGRTLGRGPELIDAVAGVVRGRRKWPSAYLLSFFAFVLAPSLATVLYFAFWASDQFAVETRFAVSATRNDVFSQKMASSSSSTGYSAAGQDAYVVSGYINSRAIVDDLSKTIDLRAIFTRPEADFWARLKPKATAEQLTDYWRGMIDAYVDGPSGIVTVTVRAFRRDDALEIADAIVKASEALANQVSARARADTMRLAEAEVGSAEARVTSSLKELRTFRDEAGFIDPNSQAVSTGSLLTDLLMRKIKLEAEYLVSARAMSPDAPTLQTMKSRLDTLETQIADEKAKLTNVAEGGKSLASLIPKFEQLELRNKFAEKIYDFARDGFERARVRAEAQTIYVTLFVPPSLPQEAKYPERIGLSIVIAVALAVLWGIGALLCAVIEDHRV